MADVDEQSLWAKLRSEDAEAYRQLQVRVERIAGAVFRRAGASTELAESLLQDVLVSIWDFAKREPDCPESLDGLLYWRARGVQSNWNRKALRQALSLDDLLVQPRAGGHRGDSAQKIASPENEGPWGTLFAQELRQALGACRQTLNQQQRDVWDARYERELTPAETAESLGLTKARIGLILHRARRALEACLAAKGVLP